jgi:hypothetical protein
MAAIRLQEFNNFAQSSGGISTWVIAGGLVGVALVGVAYGMARRKAIAREQWKKANMAKQDTVISVQRNPLISTRGVPENASPQTVFQTLQQATPANVRRASFNHSPQQTSPPLRSLTPKPVSIVEQRRDLQVFQATTVRNIRQGRGGARIHGVRKDIL